jgi:hypothetical protein
MNLRRALFLLPLLAAFPANSQSWIRVSPRALYDSIPSPDTTSINGFRDVNIFSDVLDRSVWVSKESACVSLKREQQNTWSGEASLHLKWDKVTGGCSWIGLGFGWNNWAPKDMNEVCDSAAIQMRIKSVSGSFSNLPVAFCLEDYAGAQAWYGFNKTLSSGNFSDITWSTVTIPLNRFPLAAADVDQGKIKQFIIQLEGDGDIYLDDIRIVPYKIR